MVAPIALYPDPLVAQVLMAATYPGDVAEAAAWAKANPSANGDAAVRQVANQPWDPSVQSLVAFPQALAALGQDPPWVQRLGDAFLAQPDDVMDAIQRLRHKAQGAGNLASNEYQKVSVQPAAPAAQAAPEPSMGSVESYPAPVSETIIIESADPETVYVPSYDPNTAYGQWDYPSYPPSYYPPPQSYYPMGGALATGLMWASVSPWPIRCGATPTGTTATSTSTSTATTTSTATARSAAATTVGATTPPTATACPTATRATATATTAGWMVPTTAANSAARTPTAHARATRPGSRWNSAAWTRRRAATRKPATARSRRTATSSVNAPMPPTETASRPTQSPAGRSIAQADRSRQQADRAQADRSRQQAQSRDRAQASQRQQQASRDSQRRQQETRHRQSQSNTQARSQARQQQRGRRRAMMRSRAPAGRSSPGSPHSAVSRAMPRRNVAVRVVVVVASRRSARPAASVASLTGVPRENFHLPAPARPDGRIGIVVPAAAQQAYPTPDAAAEALVKALGTQRADAAALATLLGKDWRDYIPLEGVDRADVDAFLVKYRERHAIEAGASGKSMLSVGKDAWTFPIPLSRGRRLELRPQGRRRGNPRAPHRTQRSVRRRILRAYHDAQMDYAEIDRDGDGVLEYAQKFFSTDGLHDGLFWAEDDSGEISPLGPLFGDETLGNDWHGYHFLIFLRRAHRPRAASIRTCSART